MLNKQGGDGWTDISQPTCQRRKKQKVLSQRKDENTKQISGGLWCSILWRNIFGVSPFIPTTNCFFYFWHQPLTSRHRVAYTLDMLPAPPDNIRGCCPLYVLQPFHLFLTCGNTFFQAAFKSTVAAYTLSCWDVRWQRCSALYSKAGSKPLLQNKPCKSSDVVACWSQWQNDVKLIRRQRSSINKTNVIVSYVRWSHASYMHAPASFRTRNIIF